MLREVLKILLLGARMLPQDEVPYTVARRLFGLEHFVDFDASDPASRSHLLSAAFELLDIAWNRDIPVCLTHTLPHSRSALNMSVQHMQHDVLEAAMHGVSQAWFKRQMAVARR